MTPFHSQQESVTVTFFQNWIRFRSGLVFGIAITDSLTQRGSENTMNLSNQPVNLAQGMFVSSATQQHPLGTRGVDNFGHVHRYVKVGALDTVAGLAYQSAAPIASSPAASGRASGS
jgi:hypothetical protein